MANNDNLEFSYTNLDYTTKDFGSIYPQMLDLAKRLTNKWDPSQSNESDPGVVLLKEGAFVADHNNYNIDKNILENFLPTATQDRSVRNITEMNGYVPRYYVSANGEITFKWKKLEGDTAEDYFTIPAFTIVVSDADETVSYTQIEPLVISGEGVPSSCRFIEGTLQTLSVNDSSTITLENIDDSNRLYLPENLVAQNGVYIKNYNPTDYDDYWVRNNYILTQPSGTRIYKIDYDSERDLPYIEFPEDISNLIGDGLVIQYIATSGVNGNVSANSLTKILSPSTFTAVGEEASRSIEGFTEVRNTGSITNGKDPETISEMYQSFKRIVGTFDTLVTCKDYENQIYTMADSNDNPLVSNVYVTDRRTDYNKAVQVITYDIDTSAARFKSISTDKCSITLAGSVPSYSDLPRAATPGVLYYVTSENKFYINMSTNKESADFKAQSSINLNDFALLTGAMTPYDLIIYAFKAIAMSDYSASSPSTEFDKSFGPISNAKLTEIQSNIEDVKCICHTYKYPDVGSDVYCFKNYAPIKIELETYNKVNYKETYQQIIDSVYRALVENFNPRNLEFGIKLSEDTVRKVVINSDERIRDARVDILEYIPKVSYMSDGDNVDEDDITDSSEILLDLVSKNILAGRLCLFSFDNRFTFNYGQVNGRVYDPNQSYVKTELFIPLSTDNTTRAQSESQDLVSSVRFKSTGSNYKYEFVDTNISGGIANNQSVDLPIFVDKVNKSRFVIHELDGNTGKIIDSIEYKSTKNTIITVYNKLTSGNLNQSSSKANLPEGDILIKQTTPITSTDYLNPNIKYTLNKNEAFQIIYPNYYSDKTYSLYVNYRYENVNPNAVIKGNDEHTLTADERIIFVYTKDGKQIEDVLNPGDVVKSSFDIQVTDSLGASSIKKSYSYIDGENVIRTITDAAFRSLSSGQTIAKRVLMRTVLNNKGPWCYWVVDGENGSNILFSGDDKVRILKNNEYFIYTNSSLNEMIILGAGTKLERTIGETEWAINDNYLDIESIQENGISVDIPWKKNIDFASEPFYITEMNVVTLGESDQICIYGWDKDLMPEAEDFNGQKIKAFGYNDDTVSECDGIISYTVNGETVSLPQHKNFYLVKARLDLNTDSDVEQELVCTYTTPDSSDGNAQPILISAQRITLKDQNVDTIISAYGKDNCFIQSSDAIVAIGNKINLYKNSNNRYPSFYVYSKDKYSYNNSYPVNIKMTDTCENTAKKIDPNATYISYPFFCENINEKTYIIPIHVKGDELKISEIWFVDKSGAQTIKIGDYNNPNITVANKLTNLDGNTSYYLTPSVSGSVSKNLNLALCIKWTGRAIKQNQVIIVDPLSVIDGVNPELNYLKTTSETALKRITGHIRDIVDNSDQPSTKPYYTYSLDSSIAMAPFTIIEDPNTHVKRVSWGDMLWDRNNIANKMTLAQIDIKNMYTSKLVRIKNENVSSSLGNKI